MKPDSLYQPHHWHLENNIVHLNHGSFGACPIRILEEQHELRQKMESNTLRFFEDELPALLERSREVLGTFLGAPASDLVFVDNATTGVSTVLSNIDLVEGDRILVTDHGYNACTNAARYFASRVGCEVDVVHLPFPNTEPGEFVARVLEACTLRTRIFLVDHVTSATQVDL